MAALREVLHALISAVAAGQDAPPGTLPEVERWSSRGLAGLHLIADPPTHPRAFALLWTEYTLDLPVEQAAVSATLLLTGSDLPRVKQCPGPRCGWVFVDESRNQSRRWCDPTECGNRECVSVHYRRTHHS